MKVLDLNIEKYLSALELNKIHLDIGKVTEVRGSLIKGFVPGASLGSICRLHPISGQKTFMSEVIGFEGKEVLLMPLGEMQGIGHGSKIVLQKSWASAHVGEALIGRVIDGLGQPIDDLGEIETSKETSLYSAPENPLKRPPISKSLSLGVRAVDGLITLGQGQRIGIMAGSGVGKSVLLGMMAKQSEADVNVIAMIGERGREVREFIENILGEEGLKRSVVVAATSDQNPLVRLRGAYLANVIAENFSRQGKSVLLLMDSVTRVAMAQREIGLNVGEPPASKGYTPSVFSLLPKLLERAGTFEGAGSITGLYTVLVEGDDMDDPIADAVRSIVDGHIVLDRKLAHRGHYPAIDVLRSTSRVMLSVVSEEHKVIARKFRELMAVYAEAEDLINIGAYKVGSNPTIDEAIAAHEAINNFLVQERGESIPLEDLVRYMGQLVGYEI
ncbi:MAG: FliI/YscN family ATPase [Bdellovibrionales bacterium]|nr:FliI/YscN family ATPase [Bdellovibrionales bacterium]